MADDLACELGRAEKALDGVLLQVGAARDGGERQSAELAPSAELAAPSVERLRLVLQRADSCRLLLNADGPSEAWAQSGTALIVYISFTGELERSAAEERARTIDEAVRAVLNVPIMTRGRWGDGEKTESVVELADPQKPGGVTVVVVPQASLAVKLKAGGRTASYRALASREAGAKLYDEFVSALRDGAAAGGRPAAAARDGDQAARHAEEVARKRAAALVPPAELFRGGEHAGKFSAWDERGVPTADADGAALAKNATKKLEKLFASHCKAHEKEAARPAPEAAPEEPKAARAPQAQQRVDSADSAPPEPALRVVAGTYGARQGLCLEAPCGPFSHVVTL